MLFYTDIIEERPWWFMSLIGSSLLNTGKSILIYILEFSMSVLHYESLSPHFF